MKIAHIVEDYSKLSGGIRTVVFDIDTWLKKKSIESQIITTKAEETDDVIVNTRELPKEIWCYSSELKNSLQDNQYDFFHIHGIWMYPQYIASKIAFNNKTPYLITPHGMLEPWLWENGTLKKKLYFNFMIKKYFTNANVLHAITPDEKENLHKLFKHKNIEVIPNSISYTEIESFSIKKHTREKYILFVGRLDPKKGIDLLIRAFANVNPKNVKLKIAGPKNYYQHELIKLAKDLDIESKVEFLGMVSGGEKYQFYKDAWVFVAPSYSEVVGMVNLEAGILETPVITTHQTGLYKEWNENGGVLINPNVEELSKALADAMQWSESERDDRGKKLKQFIVEHYSWENNIHKWIELYEGLNRCKN